ncbi:hypothetical protein AAGT95_01340 [Salinicola lusitanus]|uniref:Uncharacterized protein n=1 Tax=Salinicola lusitanus TaxID=1949085 RepID=A0ABZ3CTZ0_9GAMM
MNIEYQQLLFKEHPDNDNAKNLGCQASQGISLLKIRLAALDDAPGRVAKVVTTGVDLPDPCGGGTTGHGTEQ